MKRIRVLIVDDSLFMRGAIKKILDADARFEVVGQGKDGLDGVAQVLALHPDVVTMDFNMPRLDGAGAVREIMLQRPTPVVMLSAHTHEGARETFEALSAGAVDFLAKPAGEVSSNVSGLAAALTEKLVAAAGATPRVFTNSPAPPATRRQDASLSMSGGGQRICVIGVSTGGPAALSQVIPRLPGDLGFGIIIVQHMPAHFTLALAERLDAGAALTVHEARDGDRPRPGLVLIAPGDHHLTVDDAGILRVTTGPEVNGCRPSADVTMKAAARVWGRRAIGLIMTGMGRDGAEGLRAIHDAGGRTAAQDRDSSVVFGMPRAAAELHAADDILPLSDIPAWLAHV